MCKRNAGPDTDSVGCIVAQTFRVSTECIDLEFTTGEAAKWFAGRAAKHGIDTSAWPSCGQWIVKFTTAEFVKLLPLLAAEVRGGDDMLEQVHQRG